MKPNPALPQTIPGAARLLLLALLAGALPARAQTDVSGRVLDGDGAPVAMANVRLLLDADSSFVRGTLADEAGRFVLEGVAPGDYLLFVSLIGYRDYVSDRLSLSGSGARDVGMVTLAEATLELEGMTVEARRALYEQKGDRLVVHVGTSATLAGATALQVLERSPGVVVNRQRNTLSMLGKEGVQVMINGRLSYLPAEGLVQYLSGLSADAIESIELITSPPASLDAEGRAGYINLVLKQRPDDGLTGSWTASGGYGRGEVGTTSADVSYRRGRVSLFGSYSFLWNGQEQFGSNLRRIDGPNGIVETPTTTQRDPVRRNHNARVTLDYRLDEKTTVGTVIAAYDNRWSMTATNRMTLKRDGVPITRIHIDNDEVNLWRHLMGNLNLRRDVRGGTVSVDLDYLGYHNDNPTDYLNTSTDVASGAVTRQRLASGKVTPLRIFVAHTQLLSAERGGWAFGAGAKGAFSRFTNRATYQSLVQDEWVSDAGLGSKSVLREDVLAVYGSGSYQAGASASLQMGLRYELTDSNLGSGDAADLVDRRFGSLFPSVAYRYRLGEERQVAASFARRITRPSFNDMAPFLYFVDPYTFFTGNAALQPAIDNTLKLDLTYGSLISSLQYAWEDSSIARFQSRILPEHNVQLIYPTNFRKTRTLTALVALPLEVTRWWTTQNNLTVVRQVVDGYRNRVPVTLTQGSLQFNTIHNLSLPGGFNFEASGSYQSASLLGTMRFGALWSVNFGLQKTMPDGRSKLTLAVNDVFDSAEWSWITGQPGDPLYLEMLIDLTSRTFLLTYSTRFGEGKAARRRSTASQEESGRVQ